MSRKKNLDSPLISYLLQNHKEKIPTWLMDYQKGDDVNRTLEHFLSSRTFYYPGCGCDGTPVALFNSAHCIHCFVLSDNHWGIDEAKEELTSPRYGFKGYSILDLILLPPECLSNFSHAPFHSIENRSKDKKESFAILAIYERKEDYTDEHGAKRFALLYLGDDANEAYEKWFCNSIAKPPYVVLIQNGFDNRILSNGGPMNKISMHYNVFPRFLYVEPPCTMWEGYQRIPGIPFGYASIDYRNPSYFWWKKSQYRKRVLCLNYEKGKNGSHLPHQERLALKNAKRRMNAIEAQKKADVVLGAYAKLWLSRGIPLEMVSIPSGYFEMGQDYKGNNEYCFAKNESPKHKVHISKSFMLSKYPIYQKQYLQVMGNNPSFFQEDYAPVENVSWYDAKEFCERLNEIFKGRLPEGYHFDLPTEAQWEYACKAGSIGELYDEETVITPQQPYSDFYSTNVNDLAWFHGNSGERTNEVGGKVRNNWGLSDMLGNVWEWCLDWFDDYRSSYWESDYRGPDNGEKKVCRGGCWDNRAYRIRTTSRTCEPPNTQSNRIGFRVALVPENDLTAKSKRILSSAEKEKVLNALEHTAKSIDEILEFLKE